MVKLVVADIDNTLVPKHKHPSERTLKCIREFNTRGILFGFASGRFPAMLHQMEEEWGIHCDFMIGGNGTDCEDVLTGEKYTSPKLTSNELKEIFAIMEPFKDKCNTQMFINGKKYVRRIDEQVLASSKYVKQGDLIVAEDESIFWSEPSFKVGFRCDLDIMPDVRARVKELSKGKAFKGFNTESNMYEFCSIDGDKGKYLKIFCERHNIDIKDTYAFGDMTNDISILKAAGTGVCLLNGSDDAKAAADEITELTIDDDGFADYVEKHILNR